MSVAAAVAGSPGLWFVSRASGLAVLALFSAVMVLGVATRLGSVPRRWPRFVFAELHRTLALFSVAFLALHVVTAIGDPFVSIGWAATVLPFASAYRTLAISLGALAIDLGGAVLLTSLARGRLGYRSWRAVHWLAYLAWPAAFVHSLTAGGDLRIWWVALVEWGSAAAVPPLSWRACCSASGTPRLPARGRQPRRWSPPWQGPTGDARLRKPSAPRRAGRDAAMRPPPPAAASRLRGWSRQPGRPLCPVRPAAAVRPRRPGLTALLGEVERSGLTGRGGAGFPAARKLAAVAARPSPVVVANGTEGEPASAKDKVLLARSPHLVLDGAVLAAGIAGASQAIIVVHHFVREIIDDAVAERRRAGFGRVRIRVVTAADRFVAGEASAVVHWIGRGVPAPRRRRRTSSSGGSAGSRRSCRTSRPWPTSPSSPATAQRGSARSAHRPNQGPCWSPSWAPCTSPACTRSRSAPPSARSSAWLVARPRPCRRCWRRLFRHLDQRRHRSSPAVLGGRLAALGARPGAGLIAALPGDACGLAETARVVRYLADESAGQCGPCRFGLDAVAAEFLRLTEGGTSDPATLRRWLGQVDGRGACRHPDGAVRLIRSALAVFRPELERHAPHLVLRHQDRRASCPFRRGGSDDVPLKAPG